MPSTRNNQRSRVSDSCFHHSRNRRFQPDWESKAIGEFCRIGCYCIQVRHHRHQSQDLQERKLLYPCSIILALNHRFDAQSTNEGALQSYRQQEYQNEDDCNNGSHAETPSADFYTVEKWRGIRFQEACLMHRRCNLVS